MWFAVMKKLYHLWFIKSTSSKSTATNILKVLVWIVVVVVLVEINFSVYHYYCFCYPQTFLSLCFYKIEITFISLRIVTESIPALKETPKPENRMCMGVCGHKYINFNNNTISMRVLPRNQYWLLTTKAIPVTDSLWLWQVLSGINPIKFQSQ